MYDIGVHAGLIFAAESEFNIKKTKFAIKKRIFEISKFLPKASYHSLTGTKANSLDRQS